MAEGGGEVGFATSEERERTYEVGPAFRVAELAGALSGLGGVAEQPPTVVLATYFDTDVLALARAGITLRRRQGGGDPGWHLTLPEGQPDVRSEVRLPLGASAAVPAELLAAVAERVGAGLLRPVVHLRTERSALDVAGPGGEPSAQVTEDRVIALGQNDRALCTWSEVGIETRGGAPAFLDEVERLLLESGARRARYPSKVAHVLPGPAVGGKGRRRLDPIAERLAAQLAELLRAELGARMGDAEAIHGMRVASRRLRSCLHTFRRSFEKGSLGHLVPELSLLGDVLGAERDAGVLAARLEADLAELPRERIVGPIRPVLRAQGARRIAVAHRALLAFLDAPRYRALLEDLVALVAHPPFGARRRSPAWYRRQLRRSLRRTGALVERAGQCRGSERDAALHEVRKAAKHVRYAAETVGPVLGGDAKRLARSFEDLQEVLGEHHDAVVARAFLLEEGARAGVRPGENAFTYGLLFAVEDARVAAARGRVADTWRRAERHAP